MATRNVIMGTVLQSRGSYTEGDTTTVWYYDNILEYKGSSFRCITTNDAGITGAPATYNATAHTLTPNTGWEFFVNTTGALDVEDRLENAESNINDLASKVGELIGGGESAWESGATLGIRMFADTVGYVKSTTYTAKLIEVKSGDVIKANGNASVKRFLAVLTSYPTLPSSTTAYSLASGSNFISLTAGTSNTTTITLSSDAKYILVDCGSDNTTFSDITINGNSVFDENVGRVAEIEANVTSLEESVSTISTRVSACEIKLGISENNVVYCKNIPTNVLEELYLPNVTSAWKIKLYGTYADYVRLQLQDASGVTHIIDVGRNGYKAEYDNKIQSIVLTETSEVIGYFIPRYDPTYSGGSGTYSIEIDKVTSLDYNPRIKMYLSQSENLLLLGDSLFGSSDYNTLSANMREVSKKIVYNGGMPGCKMAMVGTDNYDNLTLPILADAINSSDFSIPIASANAIYNASSNAIYMKRLGELSAVDFSKPTTIFIEYCNNDLSGGVPIGNLWESGKSLTDFDKSTLLGALNYGIFKILNRYPTARIVVFTPAWRYMGNPSTAPYLYKNANNDTIETYTQAIHQNCERIGISVFDFHKYGGRNEINRNTILADDSHYNASGFALLAKELVRLDNSMLG